MTPRKRRMSYSLGRHAKPPTLTAFLLAPALSPGRLSKVTEEGSKNIFIHTTVWQYHVKSFSKV